MKSKSRLFALLSLIVGLGASANAANYCMAIRGNGELEPAHWGAVAQVIEKLGLPQAQAGGSSASITMFLVDAIATNRYVHSADARTQAARASLLIKSLQGFLNQLTQTEQWKDFTLLYSRVAQLKNSGMPKDLNEALAKVGTRAELQASAALLKRNYATGVKLGLLSQTSYAPLFISLQKLTSQSLSGADLARELAIAKFYAGELYKTVSVFGAFNAQTDSNLFFRPGIVDFDRLADQFGAIAEFYSATDLVPGEDAAWSAFFAACEAPAAGVTWDALTEAKPACAAQLSALIKMHVADKKERSFASREIGVTIPSFPSTAILLGAAHTEAVTAAKKYAAEMNPAFGDTFALSNPEDVRFGYWGNAARLARVAATLGQTDEKSRRFLNLGQATWKLALSLSPAEPGLSPLKQFTNADGRALTSAGGWSDLHPVMLLKASGCENVVYVTRRGGESLFGQGVAKRLLGYSREWSNIATKINNNGDPSDLTSLWAKLYNLANPTSSIRVALDHADAVLCTNWDKFEIKDGVKEMINDAYTSGYVVSGGLRNEGLAPLIDTSVMNPAGFPEHAGCF